MSVPDRIRKDVSNGALNSFGTVHERMVCVTAHEGEALADLADAVRDYQRTPSYMGNCDCSDCRVYRGKVMDARKRMADALARLDREASA